MAESALRTHRRSALRPISLARSAAYTVLAALLSLAIFLPLFWVVATALKDRQQVVENPLGIPSPAIWSNLLVAWETGHFGLYFANSILITVPTVLGTLLFSLLAAYAFALMDFRGKRALFLTLLIGFSIPLGVLSIPLFYEMRLLGLLDTHLALILPQIAISMSFGILLLRSFIQELPRQVLDAARIDGCNRAQLLYHVVTPLTRPALFSLLVFNFTWSWNEFLLATVLLQTEASRTLPLGLNFFRGRYSSDYPLLMAGALISLVPAIIVYVIFQRHFIKGISAGALSGQ